MKDTVFQHIMKPISEELIKRCVNEYGCDYGYDRLKTHEHLLIMVYAHLSGIKSLRTLEAALESHSLGLPIKACRSTLSDANRKRPAECFLWLLEHVMSLVPRAKMHDVNKVVRVLDSSPIQLKGHGYDEWTKHHATNRCQGLKLHTEYDLALASPTHIALSYANYNDSTMGQRWPIVANTIYVFDKGYCDFNWWFSIEQKQAFFVTRLKKNTAIIMESEREGDGQHILADGRFRFKNKHPRGGKRNLYTKSLRRVSVAREGKEPLILATNLHDITAEDIASLYKSRWDIELFFKWIKQNLKIKTFLGKSENAVKIQLITAIIAYLLVQIFKSNSADTRPLYLILTWVRVNLHVTSSYVRKHSPPRYQFLLPLFLITSGGISA